MKVTWEGMIGYNDSCYRHPAIITDGKLLVHHKCEFADVGTKVRHGYRLYSPIFPSLEPLLLAFVEESQLLTGQPYRKWRTCDGEILMHVEGEGWRPA